MGSKQVQIIWGIASPKVKILNLSSRWVSFAFFSYFLILLFSFLMLFWVYESQQKIKELAQYNISLKSVVVQKQITLPITQQASIEDPVRWPLSEFSQEDLSFEKNHLSIEIQNGRFYTKDKESILGFDLIRKEARNAITGRICVFLKNSHGNILASFPENMTISQPCLEGEFFKFKNLRPTNISFPSLPQGVSQALVVILTTENVTQEFNIIL